MQDKTRDLLRALVKDPALEELELKLRHPNIFYVLRIQDAEIRHSNFLSWLLNPRENHQLGDLFLKHFLRDIFSNQSFDWIDEFSVDQLDLSAVEIRREWQSIDVLILAKGFAVAIENKFRAQEHSDQLHRYRASLGASFPELHHVFVFLNPFGTPPAAEEDNEVWQTYTHADIAEALASILRVHRASIPERVATYMDDYLTVLRREIMKNDPLNELARRVYLTHRDAFDFIFENRPDRLMEVGSVFEKAVLDAGWRLGSPNKGYTRFLTKSLSPIVPRSSTYGWRDKEAFLFEFAYWPKNINFKTVLSPGNDLHREVISQALMKVDGASRPKGDQWLVHFNLKWSFDVTNPKHTDDVIEKKLTEIWPEVVSVVERVESAILSVRDRLVDSSSPNP